MKNFLKALAVLLLTAGAAHAWNLRQLDTGGSSWERNVGSTQESIHVGEHYLTVFASDITRYITNYVVVPITNAKVTYVQSVLNAAIAGADVKIRYWIIRAGTVVGEITNGTGQMTIANSSSAAGDVDTFTPTASNTLHQGDVVAVQSNGGATDGAAGAAFTITIRPN